MNYLGDFAEDATVDIFFTTSAGAGGAIAPSSAFEAADVKVYKDHSSSEKTTVNGVTMTSPFDALTGLHQLSIDTSIDTGDANFWQAGHDYSVVLSPDTETVDSQTVVAVLAQFSIENRGPTRFRRAVNAIVAGTVGNSATGTSIPTSALSPAGSTADQFKGRILIFDKDTTTAALRGQATDITASSASATPTLTVSALTTAPASGDTFVIQ